LGLPEKKGYNDWILVRFDMVPSTMVCVLGLMVGFLLVLRGMVSQQGEVAYRKHMDRELTG